MGSQSFKTRFLASIPPIPPDLDLTLDEFVVYPRNTTKGLADDEIQLLCGEGLPADAPPFLTFSSHSLDEMEALRTAGALPHGIFPIGHNGSGDVLGIDTTTREVVCFNHDAHDARIFINSSLRRFQEALCLYQEHSHADTLDRCLAAISAIDPPAARPDTMWHIETQIH